MRSPTIHELAPQDRPREKLEALGAAALSDCELIAILLRTGMKGSNAIDIGRQLIARFGSLSGLARCSVAELKDIKGIGLAKAVQLAAAFGLATRMARETLTRRRMDAPQLIFDLLGTEMRFLSRESLRVVLLDTKFHLLRVEEISLGSLNESIAHPREIFRPALIHAAFALVVVHNHPSGDPAPSQADHSLTRRLAEAAHLLQIHLLDHIIIGNGDNGRQPWFSFKEAGVL
ncbi:MAG: repair protein RadC [Chthoniobacteraceae bacterium]|nr:repair protein RadC [Chthoniobacteraceae bacterium]